MNFLGEYNNELLDLKDKEENKLVILKTKNSAFDCGFSSAPILNKDKCIEMKMTVKYSHYTQTMLGVIPKEKFSKDGKLSSYYHYKKRNPFKNSSFDSLFDLTPK